MEGLIDFLDESAQARGYNNWRELQYDLGKNYADQLKKDLMKEQNI
ncbi:hypothetical protein [Pediococcus pentosaceus]